MAPRKGSTVDNGYDQWRSAAAEPVIEIVEAGSSIVRRPGRPRRARGGPAAPRLIVYDPKVETVSDDEYDVDAQLDALTKKVIRRLHQEIQNYSVPQLLSGLHKCLQVRVLMATLRSKGGGQNVGSAVRKYSGAFQAANEGGNGKRSRRPAAAPADDDLGYLLDED
jgi:hypothetical protein